MKLKGLNVGDIVYFKKTNIYGINPDHRFIVEGIEIRKTRHNRIIISGHKYSAGELTDVPCSKMGCDKCKHHNRIKYD